MRYTLNNGINILQRTPIIIATLLDGLDEKFIYQNEGEDTWSPFDVVGHLIHGDKTDWIPRAKIILGTQENKEFEPFDRFAQYEDSKGKNIAELLQEFKNLRQNNIKELKAMELNQRSLELEGLHPSLGKVTLAELLSAWVVHDLNHINQICRVIAGNYSNEVGPWREYLSILNKL